MTRCRHILVAALACAAVLGVAASAPAASESKRIYTADAGGFDGQTGGHARYTTRPTEDQDGNELTRVALKACDTQEDGYGIVATIRQHGLTADEIGARGGVFTCTRKHVYKLRGKVELRVCAHDQDNDVGSRGHGYVACSAWTQIAAG